MNAQLAKAQPTAVVIDGFLDNPDEVRRFALSRPFQENPQLHKGQRTRERFLAPGMRERFESLIGRRITQWEEHGFNGVFQWCKGGDQVVFHSDQQKWAGVIYLTPNAPPEAGTTLYRSKATKGRTVDESIKASRSLPPFENSRGDQPAVLMQRLMYHGKLLDPTAWEVVDVFGNVYNRLVLWNAHLVHAASNYFGDSKENARLFQMFFFSDI